MRTIELTEELRGILSEDEHLLGFGSYDQNYMVLVPEAWFTNEGREVVENWSAQTLNNYHEMFIELIIVDHIFYERLRDIANVPEGSNILLNQAVHQFWDRETNALGPIIEFEPLVFEGQTIYPERWFDEHAGEWVELEDEVYFRLHGQIIGDDLQDEFPSGSPGRIRIVVPELEVSTMSWYFRTDRAGEVTAEVQEILEAYFEGLPISLLVNNIDEWQALERNTLGLVSVLVFSFVGVLITLSLTNVISTITENVQSRKKEFSVLASVGMTSGGIKRMLSLESILSGFKALLYGIPLGILGSYGLFNAMGMLHQTGFTIPWDWIAASTLGVFILTWLTMRHSANRLKKQNIIETIRSGSGM